MNKSKNIRFGNKTSEKCNREIESVRFLLKERFESERRLKELVSRTKAAVQCPNFAEGNKNLLNFCVNSDSVRAHMQSYAVKVSLRKDRQP